MAKKKNNAVIAEEKVNEEVVETTDDIELTDDEEKVVENEFNEVVKTEDKKVIDFFKKKSDKKESRIVANSSFTTLSALKQTMTCYEISKKDPEYIMFTKKGNLRLLPIKKNAIITFALHKSFVLHLNGDNVKPVNKDDIIEDVDIKEWNIYEIPFKSLAKAVRESMFAEEDEPDFSNILCAVRTSTGEICKLWEVARAIAKVSPRPSKDSTMITFRFDL